MLALFVAAGVTLAGYGAGPAHAGLPLTYEHMAGRPRLSAPEGVARDGSGNILVAEAIADGGLFDRVTDIG